MTSTHFRLTLGIPFQSPWPTQAVPDVTDPAGDWSGWVPWLLLRRLSWYPLLLSLWKRNQVNNYTQDIATSVSLLMSMNTVPRRLQMWAATKKCYALSPFTFSGNLPPPKNANCIHIHALIISPPPWMCERADSIYGPLLYFRLASQLSPVVEDDNGITLFVLEWVVWRFWAGRVRLTCSVWRWASPHRQPHLKSPRLPRDLQTSSKCGSPSKVSRKIAFLPWQPGLFVGYWLQMCLQPSTDYWLFVLVP